MKPTYLHPDNKDKPYVDWREPEHRMEGFLRWLKWRMDWCDLDHYMYNNTYRDSLTSSTGKPMEREQQFWYALIFGMTYQSELSWVIYNQHPHFWEIDLEELQEWNVANLARQKYNRDCKYNKGRITQQVESIREVTKETGSLEKFFTDLLVEDKNKSFNRVFNVIKDKFYKYGRMTSWLACQVMAETADLPIQPETMLATDPTCWSVRSGLMYVFNNDSRIEAKDKSVKLTEGEIEWVDYKERELFDKCAEYLGPKHEQYFTNYVLESHLCQYKKLMLGGDYVGHNTTDHLVRANWLFERWPEVNSDAFYKEAILNTSPLVKGQRESKALRNLCAHTGQMINMHEDFEDMPDIYKEMDIDPGLLKVGLDTDRAILKKISEYRVHQGETIA